MKKEGKREPPRAFKISHQILCITGINFEDKSFVGYVELTVWPAVPDLTEIRINCKQCIIYRVNIDKKWDADFTYFDPSLNIGQNNPVKRNIDYFQRHSKSSLISIDADQGNGELIIKLPDGVLPTVTALSSFQVCVEFSVQQPKSGVSFVVPDLTGTMAERSAHMFTHTLENSSRMWFPCVDSFFDPCTWKIEVTVDRDMTAVSCGDLVSVELNEDATEKTFHYFLSTPVAAPNIALAVGPFEILVDPKMHEVTHFCLPGLMPVLKHTTSYIHQAFEFYEELMSSRYPYSYYKQVFVDQSFCDVATYSTMSILSTNLLHPPNIIDQTMTSRQLMATAVAQQFFGSFIAMQTWCDTWLTKGITGYLSYLFSKRTFGNNEYRNWVMRDLQEVCSYERDIGPVILDPSRQLQQQQHLQHHPYWLGSPHTLSPRYAQVLEKKARLVVRMLEMRIGTELLLQVLNKLLSLATNASQAMFGFSSWTNMLLSTSSFLKIIYTVTGKDIEPFIDQWVYQGGCARFTGTFVFHRKRNVVELDIKQDLAMAGALKFVGTLNVTIQELDGSFNHQFKIEENKTNKFEITCHSKSRRNKKKKIPLMTGEEVDMDLSAMDADSPVLWLRLDPDLQLIRTVRFEQPDYMWQYQLKYERCIVAQFEAIEALGRFPTPASRYALNSIIENGECYYRVRQDACYCLAKVANLMSGTWTGPPAMITIFRKMFGSHSCPVIVRQNNFSNFHHYYLLKTMPQAMARLRDTHNLCLTEITKFLLDLFKYNDNSRNKWSDNYYRAALIDALAATITPAITNVSVITGQVVTAESLSSDMRLVLEEFVRCLNLEKLMPTYRFTVTVSCLYALRTLQKYGHLPNEPDMFRDYAQAGVFRDVRVAAVTCLVDFIKGDLSGEHLNWTLDLIEKDADPYLRHHAVSCLIENPPFRSSERCALNVETLVERIWSMMCKTWYDNRLRCGLADLYFILYGRQRPTCLPQADAVKLSQAEKKTSTEGQAAGETTPSAQHAELAAADLNSMSSTSAMWNPELTSIFALEEGEEGVGADDASLLNDVTGVEGGATVVVAEETVVIEQAQPTVKVDLEIEEADESASEAPVDLTMISGETVVAMEESVVTEPATSELSQQSKEEVGPEADGIKEEEEEKKEEVEDDEVREKEKREESPSHLSEDSLSGNESPSKALADPSDDHIISLDNVIKSHTTVPEDMFASPEGRAASMSPDSLQQPQDKATKPTSPKPEAASPSHEPGETVERRRSSEQKELEENESKPWPPPGPSPPSPMSTPSVAMERAKSPCEVKEEPELKSPPVQLSARRRSLRSSSQLSAASVSSSREEPITTQQETEIKEEPAAKRRLSVSPVRLSDLEDDNFGEGEEEEKMVVEEIILDEADMDQEEVEADMDQEEVTDMGQKEVEEKTAQPSPKLEASSSSTVEPLLKSPPEPTPRARAAESERPRTRSTSRDEALPTSPLSKSKDLTSPRVPQLGAEVGMFAAEPSSPPKRSREVLLSPSPPHRLRSQSSLEEGEEILDLEPPEASPPPPLSPTPLTATDSPSNNKPASLPDEPTLKQSPNEGQPSPQASDIPSPVPEQQQQQPPSSPLLPPPSSPPHKEASPQPPAPMSPFSQQPEPTQEPQPAQSPQPSPHGEPSPPPPPPPPPQPEVKPEPATQERIEPFSLKRKLIIPKPQREGEGSSEPETKRLVPPIILSSTTMSGSSSSSSLKTTFKLGAALAASSERDHHYHHKSKKKKKKNKHKHKHKHRRDREEDEETERPRERLVLDMSARSRKAAEEEEEGANDSSD